MNSEIAVLAVLSFMFLSRTYVFASPLDEELQKLKQAGIPTTFEELAPPAVSDSENAALLYQKVFDLMDKNKEDIEALKSMFYSQIIDENRPYGVSHSSDIPEWSKWTEEQKRTFPPIIEKNKEISGLLEKAVAMQRCRFPIEYKEGSEMTFHYWHEVRLCAYFMVIKATIEIEKGETEDAFNDCLVGLKVIKAMSEIPSTVSQGVRWGINKTVLSTLGVILNKGDASESLYRKIIEELDQERSRHSTSFTLKGEYPTIRARFKSFKKDPSREISSYRGQGEKATKEEAEVARKYASVIDEDEIFAAKTTLKLVSALEKPYWVVRDEVNRINADIITLSPEEHFLTWTMLSNFPFYYSEEAKRDALLGAAELGLANRIYRQKHGKFADSLNQLAPEVLLSLPLDPFTGKDYIYRLKDKGFIIYSVADNLKDDGGVSQFSEQGKKGDFDIVWEDSGAGYLDPFASLPNGNRVKILFQSMRNKTYTQGDGFPGFPMLYWSDIPDLMKIAESEQMLQRYPANSISSYISREGHPEGMIALWLIEGIRKSGLLGPKLRGKSFMVGPRFPSLNPICFEQGKANTKQEVPNKTQEIHRKVYDAYSKWWRAVKDLPEKEAVKVDPLKGTGLDWWGRTEK